MPSCSCRGSGCCHTAGPRAASSHWEQRQYTCRIGSRYGRAGNGEQEDKQTNRERVVWCDSVFKNFSKGRPSPPRQWGVPGKALGLHRGRHVLSRFYRASKKPRRRRYGSLVVMAAVATAVVAGISSHSLEHPSVQGEVVRCEFCGLKTRIGQKNILLLSDFKHQPTSN